MPVRIVDWTVDYGQGAAPCTVPHAWRQDVDVRWEGPAVYRTTIQVPRSGGWLLFWGVSYQARVRLCPPPLVSRDEKEGEGPGVGVLSGTFTAQKGVGSRAEGPGSSSPTPPSLSPGVENEGGARQPSPPTPSPFSLCEKGEGAFVHHGIWDAFTVPLSGFEGQTVEVEVEVVKNGGPTFPVKDVASGFLPYVYNTFGGLWQAVELWESEPDLAPPAPPCRVKVEGTKIFVDDMPFYLRGVLTWGWYPELGNHPCPDEETIRREVRLMKELGFNTCKFCLWVPPHRYFEILEEEGMFAWMELPLWDPTPDPEKQEAMVEELRRIVLQYRRHSNIVVWTCGCELSSNTTADFRRRLYEMVKELTGAALVKDNSGSSEMYGGDLREYGDFYDFHPYCDLPFYPVVLDSLLIGPREKKPILLGEFNDIDVHRDLPRIKREMPFWASEDPFLNDQGVRWEEPQLPRILKESRWANPTPNDGHYSKSKRGSTRQRFGWNSQWKQEFIRSAIQASVRSYEDIAGYVITGWRDTPISSSGIVDDWGKPRDDCIGKGWNASGLLFAIPYRRPPWVNGGNRPGWVDPHNVFEGDAYLQVGAASEKGLSAMIKWELERFEDVRPFVKNAKSGRIGRTTIGANQPQMIAQLHFEKLTAGRHMIVVEFGRYKFVEWLWVHPRPDFQSFTDWSLDDPAAHLFGVQLSDGPNILTTRPNGQLGSALRKGARVVALLLDIATVPMPHWRECAYDWPDADSVNGPLVHWWHVLHAVSSDRAIDVQSLTEELGPLRKVHIDMLRIDTRTYAEAPILIKAKVGKGTLVATTLRPFGGLGCQPYGVMNNPAGADLLVKLMRLAEEG